jgi:glycosyltransferase 2 family protein
MSAVPTVTEVDASDLVVPDTPPPGRPRRRVRWKALIGIAGIVGLAVAAYTGVGDAREQKLPGPGPLAAALVLQFVALICAAWGWVALFPPSANRGALRSGLYTSQLTKYLPAGGFVQAASQVALSSDESGMAAAALRLPVFSLCQVVAALTVGSLVALNGDLPTWGRILAGLGLAMVFVLDRRVLAAVLRLCRRMIKRLPEPTDLPPQRSILLCYVCCIGNMVAFAAAFAILLHDLTPVHPMAAGAAVAAGWAAGFIVVFLPSGLGLREAVVLAAIPALGTAPLLAASVAHRLAGFIAEASLAGSSHLRNAWHRRRAAKAGP